MSGIPTKAPDDLGQERDAHVEGGANDATLQALQALVAATDQPLAVIDGKGRCIVANPAGASLIEDDLAALKDSTVSSRFADAFRQAASGDGAEAVATNARSALTLRRLETEGELRILVSPSRKNIHEMDDPFERLRELLETFPLMAWVTNADNEVVIQNKASRDFLGSERFDAEAAFPAETRQRVTEAFAANLSSRKPFVAGHPALRADGEERWLQDHAFPLFDANDEFLGFAAVTLDRTTLHNWETRTRRLNRQFRLAVRDAPIGLLVLTADARFRLVNPKMCEMLGVRAEEIIGQPAGGFTGQPAGGFTVQESAEEDRQIFLGLIDRSARTSHTTRTYVRKDGSTFTGQRTMTGIYDDRGDLEYVVITTVDVTERDEAMALAHRAQAELKRLTDSIPVVIAHIGADLRFRVANRMYEQWTGIPPENLIGLRFDELFGAELYPRVQPAVEKVMAGEAVEFQWSVPRMDGETRHMLSQYVPNLDENGAQDGFFVTVSDVTESVEYAAQIKKLNEELEERVRQRTARLQNLNDELEAFCYSVSHDLRGPLRSMEGFSSLLLEEHGTDLGGQSEEWLNRIVSASRRGGRLIDELLNLSRVTRATLNREPVDLSSIAHRVAEDLQPDPARRETTFEIEPNLSALADTTLATGVLENLLGNAFKFSQKNEDARIHFGLESREGRANFYVRDNGVGFDMRFAEKLFAPFERLHQHDEFEGDGIGLATVKRIIARHNGSIRAISEPGKGATFYFSFSEEAGDPESSAGNSTTTSDDEAET